MTFSTPIAAPVNARSTDYPSGAVYGVAGPLNITNYSIDDIFSANPPAAVATTIFNGPITLSSRYIGMHCRVDDGSNIAVATARSHDMAPSWCQMNPSNGVFVDAGMAAWLTEMKRRGAEVIYTLFGTPTWASARPSETGDPYGRLGAIAEPASMASLSAFVTWLVTNYGGQIDYIEVWNEPKYSSGNSSYFSGTASKLAEMARTINIAAKAVKPSIKIMGVGAIGNISYTNDFLAASDNNAGTGKQWIDILSVHTYTQDPATTLNAPVMLIGQAKTDIDVCRTANGITGKPLWSTEFGYLVPAFSACTGPIAARIQALARYILYHVAMGADRCVFYQYSGPMGWQSADGDAEWNKWCSIINGATITRINRIGADGQLACVINGQNYLI